MKKDLLNMTQGKHYTEIMHYDRYIFYYSNIEKLTYVVACTTDYPQESAFLFLEEIIALFNQKVKQEYLTNDPSPNCIEKYFKETLQEKIDHYNKNPKKDVVDSLTEQLIGFKNTVMEANENLLQRGQEIEVIENKAAQLREDSKFYQISSLKVKKNESIKKVWTTIALIFIVLLLIYGGLAIGCGYDLSSCIDFK